MDPINIIIGINIVATFGANMSGAKKGLKSTITVAKEKPKTYLQKLPLVLSTLTLVALIFAVFQIGTLSYSENFYNIRMIALPFYLLFSWIQIWAYRSLGKNYSQEILIFRTHKLVTSGAFKIVRHPQYMAQIILDLAASVATLSYIVLVFAIIEIPFLIKRAVMEENLLAKNFKEAFELYKKKSGFMIPFIG